jgi:hypothetical protein
VACPSMKGHGNPFSVTVDALVGARFPPILGWCRHNDSHFLRALCTKQRPEVNKDCLACDNAMMNSLLVGKNNARDEARSDRRIASV